MNRDPIGESGGDNVYSGARNNLIDLVDFLGAWGTSVHFGMTETWANAAGFNGVGSLSIASADEGTDSGATGPMPSGQQDRHMLYTVGGVDSRQNWFTTENAAAIALLALADTLDTDIPCMQAASAFGRGLHSLQDISAHRPWPGGGNWNSLRAHPKWWDDWTGETNSGTAAPFSELQWNLFGQRPDYDIWDGGADQVTSQNNARSAVNTASVNALNAFETAVREKCVCKFVLLSTP